MVAPPIFLCQLRLPNTLTKIMARLNPPQPLSKKISFVAVFYPPPPPFYTGVLQEKADTYM